MHKFLFWANVLFVALFCVIALQPYGEALDVAVAACNAFAAWLIKGHAYP